jgi:hypothetical protein
MPVTADDFTRIPENRGPTPPSLLLRYALVHLGQLAHDRTDGDEVPMAHEFPSMMLGVRRTGISVAAGQFQKAGFIRHERGNIEGTDRHGLKSAACECCGAVRRAQDQLLGPPEGLGKPRRR